MQFPPSSTSGPDPAVPGFPGAAPHSWGQHDLKPVGKDPYRPALAWRIALRVLSLILLAVVVMMQRPEPIAEDASEKAAAGIGEPSSPAMEPALFAKMHLAMQALPGADPKLGVMFQTTADQMAEFPIEDLHAAPVLPGPVGPPQFPPASPPPAAMRIEAAMLAAETIGKAAAIARLDMVEPLLDPGSIFNDDIRLLRRVYGEEPAADVVASLGEQERKDFLERHGFVGKLALSYGDANAEVRTRGTRSGFILLVSLMLFGGTALIAGFVGIGMLVYLCIQMMHGRLRPRFIKPAIVDEGPTRWGWSMDPQGRLIWLETVTVFIAGFLGLKFSTDLLALQFGQQPWLAFYSLIGQWVLVLTIFWPVLRGMPMQRWRGEIGWHRGEGFFKEVRAGLMAYLASLPIYFVAALLVVMIAMIAKKLLGWDLTPKAEDNKIGDLASSGNLLVIVLVFCLATMWAPIVEESIFRGALYRHFRWRLLPVFAVPCSAFVFAIMHGYAPLQLLMVGVLGTVFALMREWRGSLIPSMTAHFVHNTVVLCFVIVLFGQVAG